MKRHLILIVGFLLSLYSVWVSLSEGADKVKFQSEPLQRVDARFRLFRTDNMWSHLLLDTSDGRLWHVTYTTDKDKGARLKIPINEKALVSKPSAKNGRFTLYPTDNMWNFLLLDQDDGRVWQCQFTMEAEDNNFCLSIADLRDAADKMESIRKTERFLTNEKHCESECIDMIRRGEIKQGLTLQDCVRTLCK